MLESGLNNIAGPEKGRTSEYVGLALVVVQLALIILVLRQVDVLSIAFRRIVYVAAVGFVVNHLLPLNLRLPFFVLLSLGVMLLVLGTPTTPEIWWEPALAIPRAGMILAVGAVLIGICHLPIGFWKRVGLLVVAAGVAATFRAGILKSGGLEIIWIILAAIFMFRIIIYLYDLSTSRTQPSLVRSVAYFFLIPNVCCMLFPVIDFKTFCNSHYNDAPLRVYQRGVSWMGRGVVQLIIYRFVDQIFAVKATSVASGTDLIRYLFANSLLYLNVSGYFHFIVGMLLLFGFNLPETNHRYFLASSFTDYWRRVNIYWKDFMVKVFYYPVFFKLKKWGATKAIVVATLWVFFATWALHLYQTWWLKGSVSVSKPDMFFWSILGLLVLANSLWEMKHPRKRKIALDTYAARDVVWLVLRTAGTFACICLLWSLWSSPGVRVWIGMWKYADSRTAIWGLAVLASIIVAKIVLEVLPIIRNQLPARPGDKSSPGTLFRRNLFQTASPLLSIWVVTLPVVQSHLLDLRLERFYPLLKIERFYDVVEAGDSLLPNDAGEELNYYKRLTSLDEGNRQLLEIFTGRPIPRLPHDGSPPVVDTQDFRFYALKPSADVHDAYETDDFQTNRWGMRDRDYAKIKPDGTVRIALLGSSHTMGYAMGQNEYFEAILEDRLNREFLSVNGHVRFEVLNFAGSGYSPLSQICVLQEKVRSFRPDVVVLVAHLHDFSSLNYHLRKALRQGYPIPYEQLRRTLREARVWHGLHDGVAEKRLLPFEPALMEWSLTQIRKECGTIGALPIVVVVPAPGLELPLTPERRIKAAELKNMAANGGFVVVDLSHLFDTFDPEELHTGIVPHSNSKSHALIADALYKHLTTDPRIDLANLARRTAAPNTTSHVATTRSLK
jgi:hypothetical protein